jgi:heme/copper-type cytochrome/quinol oxidase subunit 3
MNAIFMPMFVQGLAGLNRRLYDGGITYAHAHGLQKWNVLQGWSAWALGLIQLLFLVNIVVSLWRGRASGDNPWGATTLEWATATPPPHGNFAAPPLVYRGAYEYSAPGAARDFLPQNAVEESGAGEPAPEVTGFNNAQLGVWLFLASEVMLFGGLFSAYFMLRAGAVTPWEPLRAHVNAAAVSTLLLFASTFSFARALGAARRRELRGFRTWMLAATVLGLLFLPSKGLHYASLFDAGIAASTSTQWATYFLLTGVHALHVLGGLVVNVALLIMSTATWAGAAPRVINRTQTTMWYWSFVDVIWLVLLVVFYAV